VNHPKFLLVAQEITVDITKCVLAAGTRRPPAQQPDKDNVSNNIEFWEKGSESGGKSVAPKATSQSQPLTCLTAKYIVYSADVSTHPSEDLREGLKAMTKKDPPPDFEFQMVYVSLPALGLLIPHSSPTQFSKEQYDARAEEEKNHPMGSVFRGPQGLFPKLDGYGAFSFVPARIFILSF